MSQKSSFTRLLEILRDLNQGKSLTIENLSLDYDVSTRTIRRDFELIKETFGDFLLKTGETYKAVNKSLLQDVLSGSELASLSSIVEIFEKSGTTIKIDNKIKDLISKNRNVYAFDNQPFEDLGNRDVIHALEKAIHYRQQIVIDYKKNGKILHLTIKPYKILLLNENFYLASEIDSQQNPFLLSRISLITGITALKNTFYFNRQIEIFINSMQTPWAMFNNPKKDINVVLIASASVAKYFEMKKYLSSQKITKRFENGDIELTYTVSNLREMYDFAFKWLPNIKIIEPQEFNTILKEEVSKKLSFL